MSSVSFSRIDFSNRPSKIPLLLPSSLSLTLKKIKLYCWKYLFRGAKIFRVCLATEKNLFCVLLELRSLCQTLRETSHNSWKKIINTDVTRAFYTDGNGSTTEQTDQQ